MVYCCEALAIHTRRCKDHDDPWDCPDSVIVTTSSSSGYGLPIRDGGTSFIEIRYCPWCGSDLKADY